MLELPVKWHKDNPTGDTIDKINRGRDALGSFSSYQTSQTVEGLTKVIGSFIILFIFSTKIAFFALAYFMIALLIVTRLDKILNKKYKELNKYSNKLSERIFDYLSNIITVITLRLKRIVSKEIDSKIMASFKTEKETYYLNEFKWAFMSLSLSLMTVIALSYKAYSDFNASGVILVGSLYILYGYLNRIGETFFQFGWLYGEIVRSNARIEGAYPLDKAYEQIEDKIKGSISNDWKKVELRNLNFSYDDEGKKMQLKNINFAFKKGQRIALVGESGSGKSTILSLIRGLYSPKRVNMFIDERKVINGLDKLKKRVTLIPQDPEIFQSTIKYNITMDLPAKKEDVERVAKISQFKQVVDKLDKKYDAGVMEKGVSLSGGEKQRLALARGVLAAKKSDIILLDEPTSSVDSLNEMKIYDNLLREFKGKTIISSIHRLHLLDKFDYIYLFDKGEIIAEGTLEELKKNQKFNYLLRKSKLARN